MSAAFEVPSGTVVGSYRIVKPLGEGGMGKVYLAEHRMLAGRCAAVKFIGDPGTATQESVTRFRREAEAMARLEHPHIVDEIDFGIHETDELGVPYLVMEYLPGGDLEQLLAQRGGKLSLPETVRILVPVLEALGHAHRRGVIHRDLKPANILFDGEGRPKLGDFGLAGWEATAPGSSGVQQSVERGPSGPLTRAGCAVGTPGYMSPEQLAGQLVDATTDLFSVGVIYFRCLTGRLPSLQETPSSVAGLPPAADRPFLECVAPKERRIRDAESVKRLLEELIRPTPPAARPTQLPAAVPVSRATARRVRWVDRIASARLGPRLAMGASAGAVPGAALAATGLILLQAQVLFLLLIPFTALVGAILGASLPAIVASARPAAPPADGWLAHCARCAIPVISSLGVCPVCGTSLKRSQQ